jgi:hypothetical protein
MTAGLVTALTELRGLSHKQAPVVASVDFMAIQAVFFNRRMLEPERSPLFSMAFIAELVDGVGPDHLRSEAAVGIMAVRAFYPTLLNRVMGLFVRLQPDVLMAVEAELRLFSL